MKWFNFPSYCDTCGAAYKPRSGRFKGFCAEHAKEEEAKYWRRESVISWALSHMEEVEALQKKEIDQRDAAFQQSMQGATAAQMAAMVNPRDFDLYSQNLAAALSPLGNYSQLAGGLQRPPSPWG